MEQHVCRRGQVRWQQCLWLSILLVGVPIAAVLLGVVDTSMADIVAVFTGKGSEEARSIILDIRLPRILTGALAGMQLALSGTILQRITANPLADPSIIGISQGASFAASLFLLLSVFVHHIGSGVLPALPLEWLPSIATLGGLLSALIIYLLALKHRVGPWHLTLCGVAVGALLQALAVGVMAAWGTTRMDVVLQWLTGTLYGRSWEHVRYLLPYTLVSLALLVLLRRPLQLLGLGHDISRSFGLCYRCYFPLLLLLAAVMAASAVGTVGPIVFVGLVVPHIARSMASNAPGIELVFSAALGMLMMVASDLAGRLIGQVEEIPVGVVTVIIGVPVLAYILRRPMRR
ncbi:FecCD family ABC transporter permease [Carnimonas bestiolae]|uniref:FecCD family ABC transporter permease n=1 Tax=Carnimonas bestiolae TaxID=3402172 RepID=UPI003EDC7F17